jgi:ppGpp synthetase/RelA/SpoT-type nucleotidyltranferase
MFMTTPPNKILDLLKEPTLIEKSVEFHALLMKGGGGKYKYIRREGGPGHYRYYYADDRPKNTAFEKDTAEVKAGQVETLFQAGDEDAQLAALMFIENAPTPEDKEARRAKLTELGITQVSGEYLAIRGKGRWKQFQYNPPETKVEAPTPIPQVPEPKIEQAAPEPKASTSGAPQEGDLEAVGEHIWGSRKDLARIGEGELEPENLGDIPFEDATHLIQKKNLVPAHDLDTLRAAGMEPGAAHMYQALLTAIRAKPGNNTEERKRYLEEIRAVLGAAKNVKTLNDFSEMMYEMGYAHRKSGGWDNKEIVNDGLRAAHERANQLNEENPGAGYRVTRSLSQPGYAISVKIPAKYEALGAKFVSALKGRSKPMRESLYAARNIPAGEEGWDYLKSRGDAKAEARKQKAADRKKADPTKKRGFQDKTVDADVDRVGGKDIPDKASAARVKDTFNLREVDYGTKSYMSEADREYHTKALEGALHDFSDILGIPPEVLSFNGRLGIALGARGRGKAAAHYESGRAVINLTKFSGGGSLAHEWGHAMDNIVASHFMGAEGALGLNYVSEAPKNSKLPPEISEAMQDVMKAIMTHPDPVQAETAFREQRLAMTRKMRDVRGQMNDIAREVNAMPFTGSDGDDGARQARNKKRAELTSQYEVLRKDYNGWAKALKHVSAGDPTVSNYARYALQQSNAKYWASGKELFARAFESHIEDKLAEKNRKNTYLVSGTNRKYDTGMPMPDGSLGQPYPSGEERKNISAAMDKLMKAMHSTGSLKKALDALAKGTLGLFDLMKGPYTGKGRREGSPGNYKYYYDSPSGGRSKAPEDITSAQGDGQTTRQSSATPAAQALKGKLGDVVNGRPFEEQYQIAEQVLAQHNERFGSLLTELKAMAPGAKVTGRVKNVASALGKLVRKSHYPTAAALQDATGTRIIAKSIQEVNDIVANIRANMTIVEENDYITDPQGTYRSHHFTIQDSDGMQKEIQVRTNNQDVFAEWAWYVYKPLTPEQEQALVSDSQAVNSYASAMSTHFYYKDIGQQPPPTPPCPQVVADAFGCLSA